MVLDTAPPTVPGVTVTRIETFEQHLAGLEVMLAASEWGETAAADRARDGLFLAGGSTLPSARGKECYRALVRTRWEEAMRLRLSGLAVQAQHATSAPILRRMGFTEVAQVHTLRDP